MKQAPKSGQIILTAWRLRQPIPKALADPPIVRPWLAVFYRAFHDLMHDRTGEGSLIPWTARQAWADRYGLDAEAAELLHVHVLALDLAFQQWRRDNAPKGKAPDSGESVGDRDRGNAKGIRRQHEGARGPRDSTRAARATKTR